MNKNIVPQIQNAYIRFEPDINDGTLFIFSRQNGEMFEGNSQMYDIINLIDGENTIQDICEKLSSIYESTADEIYDTIEIILDMLEKKEIVLCRTV